ncbi:family 16 glycosylhydrolase [Mucilaginibacter sp. UR6-11]|uniref:glycoside hydrolase family 16 protein n=1 Tax=Mucilaginibacter sp. UR6-11 TaxID=1435644 RepID=UPI001E63F9E2|nr:glycoside hydrolase family 16 protein [Mucilaginibacter sp. UR6-11]MCC8425374.1 glycoside hydrolase family 16 protein [Mucilaginibacter sp. UR6-11]
MKFFCLLLLLLCFGVAASAQKKPDTLFFEDFNGNDLNRSVWNIEINNHADNNEQEAYVDSAAVLIVADGRLTIQPGYHPGFSSNRQKSNDFISGRINTRNKYEFRYGAVSARMKIAAGDGLWPAFWILGKGKWPDAGEIDIMETVGDSSWVSHAIHGPTYHGNTPLIYRNVFPEGIDVTQWHIYAVDIAATQLTFSIDGKITYTVTKALVEKYGNWVFDNSKYLLLNLALGGAYPQGVNKVKEPYPGLPQSTVHKIKAGKASFMVDWILVTLN